MNKMDKIEKNLLSATYRRWAFTFIVFMSLASGSAAQSRFSKLDEWMEINTKEMGGRAILLIYKDGGIIYNKSVNEMNRRQKSLNQYIAKKQGKEPNLDGYTMESRQLVASCSKWYSAALVMTFVDEGKLRLSDTVGAFLPVLSRHGKGNITISECLSHLTGIKEPPLKESLKEMKNISSMDQAIEDIAALPMEGVPGKSFHYSNAGLQIAGAVIEKIGGLSFEELFAERIARPLGMKNTDFGKNKVAFPAGGARSTPEDYLNFLTMILHKGNYNGSQILSEKSVNEMEINRLEPNVTIASSPAEAKGLGYGYGEWVVKDEGMGKPARWATSPGLFGSFPWIENEKHYCAFLMTFYLKNTGRNDRYIGLKQLVDECIKGL
jgi:CubicO group peptidase (beta-lactamase class C family)